MAYQPTKPQATDKLSTSQGDIAGNFTEINTYVNVDHEAFNVGALSGKHKKATFTVHAAPGAVAATEVGLYAATSAALYGAQTELFINKNASQVPFTAASKANPGWTCLPSGIIIQWAFGTIAGGATTSNILLPIAFPNAMLTVQATPNSVPTGIIGDIIMAATSLGLQTVTISRKAQWSGTACSCNVLAIGY